MTIYPPVPLVPRSRLVEVMRGFMSYHSDDKSKPDMNSERNLVALMEVVVSECEARACLWMLEVGK